MPDLHELQLTTRACERSKVTKRLCKAYRGYYVAKYEGGALAVEHSPLGWHLAATLSSVIIHERTFDTLKEARDAANRIIINPTEAR